MSSTSNNASSAQNAGAASNNGPSAQASASTTDANTTTGGLKIPEWVKEELSQAVRIRLLAMPLDTVQEMYEDDVHRWKLSSRAMALSWFMTMEYGKVWNDMVAVCTRDDEVEAAAVE